MKTLKSFAVIALLSIPGAYAACEVCPPPAPVCEPPCPAMIKTECVPMVRVAGPCCTTKCCPEVRGILGTYVFGTWF